LYALCTGYSTVWLAPHDRIQEGRFMVSRKSVINWPEISVQEPFRSALGLMSAIRFAGYDACIVGGTVRDLILREPVQDIDIATDMPMDVLYSRFACHDIGKSKQFGLVLVHYGGSTFEVAQFRSRAVAGGDGGLADSFAADAALRDFTINALALTEDGDVIDPVGGLADLENKILRAVGRPEDRLAEDVVRTLRAPRFAVRFGLEIESDLQAAIRIFADRIGCVAQERITAEILKMASLDGAGFAAALEAMDALGLLREVLPEVHALKGFFQPPEWHPEGDVYEHTLAALRCNASRDAELNLAILFHDLGKPQTYRLLDERHTYHGHDEAGQEVVAGVARRLGLGKILGNRLAFVAGEHMRAKLLGQKKPSKVQRLLDDPAWPLLKAATLCDCAASGIGCHLAELKETIKQAENLATAWRSKRARGRHGVLSGGEIMRITGLSEGPMIGELMRAVNEWALDNGITDRDAWIAFVKSRAAGR
jgi:tRNA nucleotidyltransferase/poly(A) polymerase